MSKSDAEMDDDKILASDSGNVPEPGNDVLDAKVEKEGEKLPEFSVSGDAIRRENGGEDVNNSRDEDIDVTEAKNEVKDQAILKTEANNRIDGSICEQTDAKCENVEPTIAKSKNTKPNHAKNGNVEPTNAKSENVEPNHAKNENVEPTNAKSEHVEPTDAKSENVELTNAKTDDQASPGIMMRKQMDAKNEVVEQNATNDGVEEEKSSDNGMDEGNIIKTDDEKTNENVEEKKCEEIDKMDIDNVNYVAGGEKIINNADAENDPMENSQPPTELSANEAPQIMNAGMDEVPQDEGIEDAANLNTDKTVIDDVKEQDEETVLNRCATDRNAMAVETAAKHASEESSAANQHEAATPISMVRNSLAKPESHSGEMLKASPAALPLIGESDDGTPEEQAAFMKEIESFYRERAMDFKPPKFYGKPLNCLKLWRAVLRLGGYDRVSGCKLWRQVGESFHPPKTCTTVSWTFRIFYEKSLLEYERHKTQSGELQLPVASFPEASGADVEQGNGYQGPGSGRARRDSATRAMQGWHAQRQFSSGEVGEPIIKDKNHNNTPKREKNLKSIGSLKQKRQDEVEHSSKAARAEISRQLVTPIVDVGPPADWVKINVRQAKDCFEIYALVPGLLREEVRVQTDPAGRVVITGQPEQVDNPWGITPFRKVVSLPARIDPIQTSAVFSLHGRLLIRVPFEHSDV